MPSVAEIRAQAEEVAAGWSAPGAPDSWRLTAALFRAIAADADLLGRLATLPADRLPALLASAAVSFLVRRDQPAPLAGYFPDPGAPQPPFDDGYGPALRDFIAARRGDILAVCQGRRYQMNEVARCAQIAVGLAATSPATPVGLADLGTGAGLGLQLDRYRYQVGQQDTGPAAALRLDCAVRGPRQPPRPELPPIVARAGLDLNPIDVRDPAARRWLQACAPPEAAALTRLTAAIEVTRRHPVPLLAGDVVDALPGLLDRFPAGLPLVVVDAYLAVFLPAGRRAELAAMLAAAGRDRPVTWLSLDPLVPLGPAGRDSVQGLPLPGWLVRDYAHGVFAVLGARTFHRGAEHGQLLAGRTRPASGWNGTVPVSQPVSRSRRPRSARPTRRPGPARPAGSWSAARPAAPGPAGSSTPGTAT